MNRFCINTLTHGSKNRVQLLNKTIDLFVEHTDFEDLHWFIYINGSDGQFDGIESELIRKYPDITWSITHSNVNSGVGAGINKLNEQSKDYEYTLFLEGDWFTVPEKLSHIGKNWLNTCIELLDESDASQIFLRKYIDDLDDRMYGYGYWIMEENVINSTTKNDIEFLILKEKEYSNNPHIRKNKDFYDLGIFPLNEFYDSDGNPTEIKGNEDWGQAEIKAEGLGKQLNTMYIKFGKFIHGDGYDREINDIDIRGCGQCKYGLMEPTRWWCSACIDDNDYSQFVEQQWYYERVLAKTISENEDNPEKIYEVARNYHRAERDFVSKVRSSNYKLSIDQLNEDERFKR
tara:strand:- start:2312 stop:3349 length:1038 start_codon:yes stop_codon:yes gene_type:complete